MINRMPGLERDMREFIVENLTNTEALSVTVILMNNVIALIVAFFIMFTYKISYAGPAYSRKFNISIGSITIIFGFLPPSASRVQVICQDFPCPEPRVTAGLWPKVT